MPMYDYECLNCGNKFEAYKTISACNEMQYCQECGYVCKKLIVKGHGGTHGDEAAWIRKSNEALHDGFSKPVENRTELKNRERELGVTCIG